MQRHASHRRPSGRVRGLATLLAALAGGAVMGAFAGCSTADCRSMKSGGSFMGDLVCGGQGTDAPEPDAAKANACTDVRQVMPGFFKLLEDPAKPLANLREAVKIIGTPVCMKPRRACTSSEQCIEGGDCGADGFCPCAQSYSPLADLLQITFRGLAAIAKDRDEPGAVGGRCLSAAAAASLPPESVSRMCEVRRMLDVLLQQHGGQRVLDDPNVKAVILNLMAYVEGKTDGKEHYDLFTTLGRMAQNPGICSPADAYDLLDRTLAFYTPAKAAQDIGAIQELLADPLTQRFLAGLSNGGAAPGRQTVIVLAHDLLGAITSARSSNEATAQIKMLLDQLVYPYLQQNFPAAFVTKVKNAVNAAIGPDSLLSEKAGVFPLAQRLLVCASNPIVDKDGELIGAIYDLLSRDQANGGLDLAPLFGALKTLMTLDTTGQVTRSLRLLIRSARNDDDATDAVRALLAQVLTAETGEKLLPPVDALVRNQVLGEVLTLLNDLLYSCQPHPGQP